MEGVCKLVRAAIRLQMGLASFPSYLNPRDTEACSADGETVILLPTALPSPFSWRFNMDGGNVSEMTVSPTARRTTCITSSRSTSTGGREHPRFFFSLLRLCLWSVWAVPRLVCLGPRCTKHGQLPWMTVP